MTNKINWKDIITRLGLDYNDQFTISCDRNHVYKFTHYGLLRRLKTGPDWVDVGVRTLVDIIEGKVDTEIVDWVPKSGDTYYTYNFENYSSSYFVVVEYKWGDGLIDLMRLKLGMVFKTKDAAMRMLEKRNVEFLEGIPYESIATRKES